LDWLIEELQNKRSGEPAPGDIGSFADTTRLAMPGRPTNMMRVEPNSRILT
jgi:hypothetical protein